MAFYKLLAGKHHFGWQRKLSELTVKQLQEQFDIRKLPYRETDKRAKLEDILREEVGGLIDTRKTYSKGDIIETSQNLCELNDPGNPANNKFEQVNRHGQAITEEDMVDTVTSKSKKQLKPVDTLESKTVAQLKELAAGEEIDIDGLTRKDELIAALRTVSV